MSQIQAEETTNQAPSIVSNSLLVVDDNTMNHMNSL
jgi:hypothetical protein